jgi:predicted metal-dependent HD superfamily phosphohydrolase
MNSNQEIVSSFLASTSSMDTMGFNSLDGVFMLVNYAQHHYSENLDSWDRLRAYHTWSHAQEVAAILTETCGNPLLVMAGLWHDAAYGVGSPEDENLSADMFEHAYQLTHKVVSKRSGGVEQKPADERLIDYIASAIRATAYHLSDSPPCNNSQLPLLDADLSSLAKTYSEFVDQGDQIIHEAVYGHYGDSDKFSELSGTIRGLREKRASFLRDLQSKRKHLFWTDVGRDRWESKAQANIIRYVKEFEI